MIKKIRQNKKVQIVLQIANYFVSIGFIALFFETETMVLSNKYIILFRNIFNYIYTRNIQFFSLFIVGIISVILLDFKRNIFIKISFILNTIIILLLLFWGIIFYFAY